MRDLTGFARWNTQPEEAVTSAIQEFEMQARLWRRIVAAACAAMGLACCAAAADVCILAAATVRRKRPFQPDKPHCRAWISRASSRWPAVPTPTSALLSSRV